MTSPDAEYTSAALRRVEQERDEARAAAEQWCQRYADLKDERDEALAVQRDAIVAFIRISDQCSLLKAELASARTELEQLRAATDPYPNPSCGKPTGNASNRCLRAPGHDGWCDDDPPVLPYRELERVRTELDAVRTARDNLDRQLAAARTEITDLDRQVKLCPRCGIELNADLSGGTPALTSWIVARDGGRDCIRCDQEIRRGEAYELMPGVDQLCHIHCPDRTEEHHG